MASSQPIFSISSLRRREGERLSRLTRSDPTPLCGAKRSRRAQSVHLSSSRSSSASRVALQHEAECVAGTRDGACTSCRSSNSPEAATPSGSGRRSASGPSRTRVRREEAGEQDGALTHRARAAPALSLSATPRASGGSVGDPTSRNGIAPSASRLVDGVRLEQTTGKDGGENTSRRLAHSTLRRSRSQESASMLDGDAEPAEPVRARLVECEASGLSGAGPSPALLRNTHPVVEFLSSVQLQGFAADLVLHQGLDTLTALDAAVPYEDATQALLGPYASRAQRSELWKGLQRYRRDALREARRQKLEEARELKCRRKRRGTSPGQGRRRRQGRAAGQQATAETPEANEPRAEPHEHTGTQRLLTVHSGGPRTPFQPPQTPGVAGVCDSSAGPRREAEAEAEVFSLSQLCDRIIEESNSLHAQGRKELALHATALSRGGPKEAAAPVNDAASRLMHALSYREPAVRSARARTAVAALDGGAAPALPSPTAVMEQAARRASTHDVSVTLSSSTAAGPATAALTVIDVDEESDSTQGRDVDSKALRKGSDSRSDAASNAVEEEEEEEGLEEQMTGDILADLGDFVIETVRCRDVSVWATDSAATHGQAGESVAETPVPPPLTGLEACGSACAGTGGNDDCAAIPPSQGLCPPTLSANGDPVLRTADTTADGDVAPKLPERTDNEVLTRVALYSTEEEEETVQGDRETPTALANDAVPHPPTAAALAQLRAALTTHIAAYNDLVALHSVEEPTLAPLRAVLLPLQTDARDESAAELDRKTPARTAAEGRTSLVRVGESTAADQQLHAVSGATPPAQASMRITVAEESSAALVDRTTPRERRATPSAPPLSASSVLPLTLHTAADSTHGVLQMTPRAETERLASPLGSEESQLTFIATQTSRDSPPPVPCEESTAGGATQPLPRSPSEAAPPHAHRKRHRPDGSEDSDDTNSLASTSWWDSFGLGALTPGGAATWAPRDDPYLLLGEAVCGEKEAAAAATQRLEHCCTGTGEALLGGTARSPVAAPLRVDVHGREEGDTEEINVDLMSDCGSGRPSRAAVVCDADSEEEDELLLPPPALTPARLSCGASAEAPTRMGACCSAACPPCSPKSLPLEQLRALYAEGCALESESLELLQNLCEGLGQTPDDAVGMALPGTSVHAGDTESPWSQLSLRDCAPPPSALSPGDNLQLMKDALAEKLRVFAVRDVFRHQVAPACLHRAPCISGLPYVRVKAADLLCRGRALTAEDLQQAKADAKAREAEETHRCIAAALAADACERAETRAAGLAAALPASALERAADSSEPGSPLQLTGSGPAEVSLYERVLLMEPVDADAVTALVQRSFDFVSRTRVQQLLEANGISLEVVHYGSSPSPSPPRAAPPLSPLTPDRGDSGARSPETPVLLPSEAAPTSASPYTPFSSPRTPPGSAVDASLLPDTSADLLPTPEQRRRANSRQYFASMGFRTRGGLYGGRGRGGWRGRGRR